MIKPAKDYFLIRISRSEKDKKKEKIGRIFLPPSQVFMTRNTQCGEVIDIGEKAHKYFPEVKVGNTLLIHHFCEGENETDAREDHLVHQDENYNYYVVSAYAFNRKNVETYGVWDGEKIIPNKDYIFLEPAPEINPQSADDYINAALQKKDSGLFLFKEWKESRESKTRRMKFLKSEIESLSKSGLEKGPVIQAIELKQAEIELLSAEVNKRTYEPYRIAAFNNQLQEWFDAEIKNGDEIWMLNIAAQTEIEFNNKKYIVAKVEYIGFVNKVSA